MVIDPARLPGLRRRVPARVVGLARLGARAAHCPTARSRPCAPAASGRTCSRAAAGSSSRRDSGSAPAILSSAHAACSRTSGDSSSSARASAGTSSARPRLPSATQTLRRKPSRPARRTAVPSNVRGTRSSSSASQASSGVSTRNGRARVSSLCDARAKRFHGQTSRQSSQPKMRCADERPQLDRHRALQFDRQVADAAPRVDVVGRADRAGRAGVDAAAAGAAAALGRACRASSATSSTQLAEHRPVARRRDGSGARACRGSRGPRARPTCARGRGRCRPRCAPRSPASVRGRSARAPSGACRPRGGTRGRGRSARSRASVPSGSSGRW